MNTIEKGRAVRCRRAFRKFAPSSANEASKSTDQEGSARRPCSRSSGAVLLLLGLSSLLSGCWGGTVAILSSGGGGGGGGGNAATVVGDLALSTTRVSPARVSFTVTDQEGDPVDVSLIYLDPNTGLEVPLSLVADAGQGIDTSLTNLTSSANGTSQSKLWDFAAQLGPGFRPGVSVLLRVAGRADVSVASPLGNDAPQLVDLQAPTAEVEGIVVIPFTARDSSDDSVTIDVEFISGSTQQRISVAGSPPGEVAFQNVTATAAGTGLTLFWDAPQDLPLEEREVSLLFTIDDGVATTQVQTATFQVDNNEEPFVVLNAGSVLANPDTRRGIPLPFLVDDREGDTTRTIIQWATTSRPFPSLPTDLATLQAIFDDPGSFPQLQIATERPRRLGGVALPAGAGGDDIVLDGLSNQPGLVSDADLLGRTVEILEPPLPLQTLGLSLTNPVAVVTTRDRQDALVLQAAGPGLRLTRLDLDDGTSSVLLESSVGTPSAMAWDLTRQTLLIGTDVTGTWTLHRFDPRASTFTPLGTVSGGAETGTIRGVAPVGPSSFALTVGSSLVVLDEGTPANVRTVRDDLQGPFGLVTDPVDPRRVYVAETDWFNPRFGQVRGRIAHISTESHAMTSLASEGTLLPRPTQLAMLEGRFLAVTDANTGDGVREVLELRLDGSDLGPTTIANLLAGSLAGVAVGNDHLRLVLHAGDLLRGGGVADRRQVTARTGNQVTLNQALGTPLGSDGRTRQWRILDQVQELTPANGPAADQFVWDTTNVPAEGQLFLRAVAFDTDAGRVSELTIPKAVKQRLEVTPVNLEDPGVSDDHRVALVADYDGDGDQDVLALTGSALEFFVQVSPGTFSTSAMALPGSIRFQGVPLDIGDLDADGDRDFVLGFDNDDVLLYSQTTPGTFVNTLTLGGTGRTDDPDAVRIADLDQNGQEDVIVTSFSRDRLRVFLRNGAFDTVGFDLGSGATTNGPTALDVADVDRNGLVDVLCANRDGDNAVVFLQTTPGAFDAGTVIGDSTLTPDPTAISALDFDGDGDLDVAVGFAGVRLFLQQDDGSFATDGTLLFTALGDQYTTMTTADLDGDSRVDLVAADVDSDDGTDTKEALTLTLQSDLPLTPRRVVLPQTDTGVSVGDIDSDGDADLVAANGPRFNEPPTLFSASSPGSFDSSDLVFDRIAVGRTQRILVGDFDGDSLPDVACLSEESTSVLLQIGPGVFPTLPSSIIDYRAREGAVGDFDADGDLDLALIVGAGGPQVTVFANNGSGTFSSSQTLSTGNGSSFLNDVKAADVDADGFSDLLASDNVDDQVQVWLQSGSSLSTTPDHSIGSNATIPSLSRIAVADIDGNGLVDVAVTNNPEVALFLQGSAGTFGAGGDPAQPNFRLDDTPSGLAAIEVVVADLDADGRTDVAALNAVGRPTTIWFQRSNGTFDGTADVELTSIEPCSLAVGDVDGDGDQDLIVGNNDSLRATEVFFQRAPGVFAPGSRRLTRGTGSGDSADIQVVDLDGDGDPDILTAIPPFDVGDFFPQVEVFYGGR